MMEASAQLLLESSVPKTSSTNPVSSQNANDDNGPSFSEYLNNSRADINEKKSEPESTNNRTTSRSSESNETRPTRSPAVVKNSQQDKNKLSQESEQQTSTENADSATSNSQRAATVKKDTQPETNDTTQTFSEQEVSEQQLVQSKLLLSANNPFLLLKTNVQENLHQQIESAHLEAEIDLPAQNSLQHLVKEILHQVATKTQGNPDAQENKTDFSSIVERMLDKRPINNLIPSGLQLKMQEQLDDAENLADVKTDIELPFQQTQSLSSLLAKLLNSQSDKPAVVDKKQVRIDALTKTDYSEIKTTEISKVELEKIVEVLDREGIDLENLLQNDSFLTKLVERLDLDKSKNDLLFQVKMANEKSSNLLDFMNQLTQKTSSDGIDKTAFLNSLNAINKPNNILPQHQFVMATPVSSPGWGTEFSKRIHFMIKSDIQHAELRLDPPELGRIHVKINLNQDQANVTFTAAHHSVRDVIEQTLPRLRELLNESGLQLGQTDVASQFQQQKDNYTGDENHLSRPVYAGIDEESITEASDVRTREYSVDGVIDYFA